MKRKKKQKEKEKKKKEKMKKKKDGIPMRIWLRGHGWAKIGKHEFDSNIFLLRHLRSLSLPFSFLSFSLLRSLSLSLSLSFSFSPLPPPPNRLPLHAFPPCSSHPLSLTLFRRFIHVYVVGNPPSSSPLPSLPQGSALYPYPADFPMELRLKIEQRRWSKNRTSQVIERNDEKRRQMKEEEKKKKKETQYQV